MKDKWIDDCYRARVLLDWKKYKLGRYVSPPESEQEEVEDETESVAQQSRNLVNEQQQQVVTQNGENKDGNEVAKQKN